MYQTRMSTVAILALSLQMAGQPGWSQSSDRAEAQLPVYLCQFGDTAHVYAFKQRPNGQWDGLGQLEGWKVTEQNGGLVARNATDTIMLGDGSASLLQEGRLVQGKCADATQELAQLFETEDFTQGDTGQKTAERIPDPPQDPAAGDEASRMAPQLDSDLLIALDPQNWDAAKVAAIINALNLDNSTKDNMRAELKAAARDPVRIERLVRQIEEAFGIGAAATDELRAKLRDMRQELASTNQAFDEQRQRLKETSARLTDAVAKANAAQYANQTLSAQLTAAQRDAAGAQRDAAGAIRYAAGARKDLTAAQRDLAAAAARYEALRASFSTMLLQLSDTRAYLATANKRIVKLGGVPVRQ